MPTDLEMRRAGFVVDRKRGVARPLEALPNEMANPSPARPSKQEIKKLHEPFSQWLNLNEVPFDHSRPDRATTGMPGQFDFVCRKNGKCASVEFKDDPRPEKYLSEKQKEWLAAEIKAGNPCLVTNDLAAAMRFVRTACGLENSLENSPAK